MSHGSVASRRTSDGAFVSPTLTCFRSVHWLAPVGAVAPMRNVETGVYLD